MTEPTAYPLHWPVGWPRTPADQRKWGHFKGTPAAVLADLIKEIDMLVLGRESRGLTVRSNVVISTNAQGRKSDGLPFSDVMNDTRIDPGVAVYFWRKKKPMCFACDSYDRIWKNVRAIALTLEAMRGIERWGSAQILDRAFEGFLSLPEKGRGIPWYDLLKVSSGATTDEVKEAFRLMAKVAHPDRGGDLNRWHEINEAYNQGLATALGT